MLQEFQRKRREKGVRSNIWKEFDQESSTTDERYQATFNFGYEELCKLKWTHTKKTTGRYITVKPVKTKTRRENLKSSQGVGVEGEKTLFSKDQQSC